MIANRLPADERALEGVPAESLNQAKETLSQGVQQLTEIVRKQPGVALGVALIAGVAIGWWVKRK